MPEPEEENHDLHPKSKPQEEHVMDFDTALENSWPLDHVSFVSNPPMSPFLLSTSYEQPFSPLWVFSDVEEVAASGDHSNTATENPVEIENDDNKKPVTPLMLLPSLNLDGYFLIKEKMTQALRNFKELAEQNFLAQVWAPVRKGNRYALTTSGQPFVLDPHSNGLHQYRTVSLMYLFSVDGDNDEILGLPGRVFQQKIPEWTPNVQYYSSKEYSRLNHAQHYNVRGTLALPVFEPPPGESCVGVLELIMTSEKINYAPEVDKVCKALEAVNLRSSEILEHPYAQICNEGRRKALAEILETLTVVCETHNLPLAQTWVPCRHRSVLAHGGGRKKSCSSFDGCCIGQVCMSTSDVAFYIIDAHTRGFHDACVEHHLQQGQGVAGRAFLSHNMSFCGNVTQFCKTEYPLVHYALMFELTSCFAICLQSPHTGDDDYVLEFFLPPRITDFFDQKSLSGSILATMKKHFKSLKISAAGIELEEDGLVEIIEPINGRVYLRVESIPIIQSSTFSPFIGEGFLPLDPSEQKIKRSFHDIINDGGELGDNNVSGSIDQISSLETKSEKKSTERKRGKAEKSISLEVLQHYFTGSLKDAAKSLGVCPTTMKRICRQHGIPRWPSRKINKVNRSLSKLKCVIESVQSAEEAFGLNSQRSTSSVPPAAAGSLSEPSTSNKFNHQASIKIRPSSEPQLNQNDLDDKGESSTQVGTKVSNRIQIESASSEHNVNPTPLDGSCHDVSLPKESNEQCLVLRGSMESTLQPTDMTLYRAIAFAVPNVVAMESQEPFEEMLIEGAGSSKDLRNLCASGDPVLEDQVLEACGVDEFPGSTLAPKQCMDTVNNNTVMTPSFAAQKEMKCVTIKATYREDIIRFRVSLNCGIVELREEIAKRLKLKVGTFDIKYLDDDHEWVLIACDADLQECIDILSSSGSNIIRLVIHDIVSILGSSCESSG